MNKIKDGILENTVVLLDGEPYKYRKDFGIVCVENEEFDPKLGDYKSKDDCQGP